MDVRTYTYTSGSGLVEDADTAGAQPEDGTPEFNLYRGGQEAAIAIGSALTWNGGSRRIRVTTDPLSDTPIIPELI